ncbi:MAG: chitobiase/beta-hexosaminidase C-terminal domain-containing protein, partial [Spirochaetota bacterium]|nr:chitobiase/beta-hexosaminidase C-terminal domain-containing protein [Spirochaetota bacterium]
VYGDDLLVVIKGTEAAAYQYRFSGSAEQTWIDYRVPLQLTALPGEEREFQLQVREKMGRNAGDPRTFSYVIDKLPPGPPGISFSGGKNGSALQFTTQGAGDTVQYWIDSFQRNEFRRWTGGSIPLAEGVVVKAYAVDRAGNHSAVVTRQTSAALQCTEVEAVDLRSPVEGNFQNKQMLVIANTECFEWVRYSTDGSNPEESGTRYEEPVLLDLRGEIRLRIAAGILLREEVLSAEVVYSVSESQPDQISIENGGAYNNLDRLPAPDVPDGYVLHYSLKEKEVSPRDTRLTEPVQFSLTEGMINYIPYRIGVYDTAEGIMHQYRAFYIVDRRIPAPPIIETVGTPPFQTQETVRIRAPKEAVVYYTTDGSTPDRFAGTYRNPFTIRPEGFSNIGAVDVQAVAKFPNGNTSEVSRLLVPFDREAPASPAYTVISRTQNETVFELNHPEKNIEFVYNIGYDRTSTLQLESGSSRCGRLVRVAFPYGYTGSAMIRFGARDEAGNLSQPTALEEISVDTVPPPPPEIIVRDLRVNMTGEGRLFYRIEPGDREYKEYSEPVRLTTVADEKVSYQIYGTAEDAAGNVSPPAKVQVVYDRRPAELPEISGIRDGAHYREPITIRSVEAYPDSVTYYTLTAEEQKQQENAEAAAQAAPEDAAPPDLSDRMLPGSLTLRGEEKREIVYTLRIRSYIPGSESWSVTAEYRFIIDRLAPAPKDMQRLIQPGLFNETFFLREKNIPETENLWLYVSDAQLSPEDFTAENIRDSRLSARSGVNIEGKPGEEITYYIYTAAFDLAGNSSVSGPFSVVIDRSSPEVPVLSGLPSGRFTRSPVTIRPPDGYEHTIRYELTDDDSIPSVPGDDSQILSGPISLQNDGGKEKSYYLLYRAVDAAGNYSDIGTVHVTILRTEPSDPVVNVLRVGQRLWEITIDSNEGEKVFYSIAGGEFTEYTYPVLYEMPSDMKARSIEAYSVDESGGRSNVVTRRFDIEEGDAAPVQGVEDGRIYNRDVTVTPLLASIDLRYELTVSQVSMPVLTGSSPRMTGPLKIPADPQRETRYRLRVGIYEPITGSFHGMRTYNFTVDTAPPTTPELVGIEAGVHYTEDQTVRIESEEDDAVIYYSIRESEGPETPAVRYTKPEKVQVRGGVRKDFTVEMWAVDQAGNRSRTSKVSFVIDKAGIYVSPEGRDGNNGGKDAPFRTLDRALYEAANSNRNTIYLSKGEYTLSKPVIIDTQLNIRGGYESSGWTRSSGNKTLISADPSFPAERSVFELRDGTLRLDDIVLSDHQMSGPIILQKGDFSTLIVRQSLLLHASGRSRVLIRTSGGNLLFTDTRIEVGEAVSGRILQLSEASLAFKDSMVEAADVGGALTVFDLDRCEAEFTSAGLTMGRAGVSITVRSRESDIRIMDSFVENGAGSAQSTAVRQEGGTLEVRGSTIGKKDGEP